MDVGRFIVTEEMKIIQVMERIEENSGKTAFVCRDGVLAGAVSDGDIRRYILNHGDLNAAISEIANYNPVFLPAERKKEAAGLILEKAVDMIPIVDKDRRIIEIVFQTGMRETDYTPVNAPLVIMAGGKGTRLKPYTDILPKPLIPIGDKTISEHIMDRFERYQCSPVYMIVNYKKNFIKAYFMESDDARPVCFIEETEYLGTGGGLRLLEGQIQEDFFMTNCDVLVDTDYHRVMEYHKASESIITMICAKKEVVIPYGTVELDSNGYVQSLSEKPRYEFRTNTGMYVISPAFLKKIPENTALLMTDIIQKCMDEGEKVGVYTIGEEDWMDMGQMEELEKMRERLPG